MTKYRVTTKEGTIKYITLASTDLYTAKNYLFSGDGCIDVADSCSVTKLEEVAKVEKVVLDEPSTNFDPQGPVNTCGSCGHFQIMCHDMKPYAGICNSKNSPIKPDGTVFSNTAECASFWPKSRSTTHQELHRKHLEAEND